jgi:hypothetical protein
VPNLRTQPSGEDGVTNPRAASGEIDELENAAQTATEGDTDADGDDEFNEKPSNDEFLQMVREADQQGLYYSNQVNRRSWERVYRAYHQEHFTGSKYTSDDYKNRSKLFIPKTRAAIEKDLAAVAASLFGSLDAVSCMPGNEGDAKQRASASVLQELVNYRTDGSRGSRAAIPWFHVAMGARQTSKLTGVCLSKQSWKLELKREGSETFTDEEDGEEKERDVWKPWIDRPDVQLIPPENYVIDPAADWTNPAQDAAYILIKWPMRIDEIRRKQKDPRNPWKAVDENILKSAGEGARMEAAAIRRAREQGLDRYDESQTGPNFDIIWVWETYLRTAGEDWTFISVGDKHMLTDPKPVSEVYPEQFGERPLAMGYGAFEAFRIFPMSSAESWQMLQQETNDLRNLSLDAIKQNVMPVSKVVRGKNVDLDQLKRRGQGTSIMVSDKDDVTWEKVPDISGSVMQMAQSMNVEFDDIAGQQNYGTVQDNNQLGKTLGGLKLAAGAANAVQEFNIRIWIETWCERVLSQIVRLEQYYESDPIVLGIAGDRAQLLTKYGVDEIDNELLENTVTIRVNIGLGAGDPQQRLAKFQSATQIFLPLAQASKEFQSGEKSIDIEAIMQEIYGGAGYRDGGKRFIKTGPPAPNPMQQPQLDKLISETDKNKALAKKAIIDAMSGAAKVGLSLEALKAETADNEFWQHLEHLDQAGRALDLGHKHGLAISAPKALPGAGAVPPGPAPGEGAAPPSAPNNAGGGDGLIAPNNVGAGNAGVSPADLGRHGIPAADAGQQHLQDQAAEQHAIQQSLKKPTKRKITIAKRGPDGRASEFHVTEE